jgi:hypothetical protein
MNLNDLFKAPTQKLAAAAPTPPTAPTTGTSPLSNAINAATAAAESEKVASQTAAPIADLEKAARAVSDRNRADLIKEAHDIGRAIADGFMAQVAVYEKVASQMGPSEPSDAEKQAAYEEASARFTQQIHTLGAEHYVGGYQMAQALLSEGQ